MRFSLSASSLLTLRAVAVCFAVAARNAAPAADIPAHDPVVVELFTSEGCSSCPAAEAVLGKLSSLPGVIAIAHHVDYWDSESWRDRFGTRVASLRQDLYVRSLHLPTAFTPQIIVNGDESYVGSDSGKILAALTRRISGPAVKITVDKTSVSIMLPKAAEIVDADVYALTYLDRASTAIRGGENAGRSLDEFDIVRSFKPLGHWHGDQVEFLESRETFPRDANRIAVFAQRPGVGRIFAASAAVLEPLSQLDQ